MAVYNRNKSWPQHNDTNNMGIKIKQHIKRNFHTVKYTPFNNPPDIIDRNIEEYNGFDHIKALIAYSDEMNLGKVDINDFQCNTKSKIPAYYANIKLGNTYVASSFPEKYSLSTIAKQVAARNALAVLKEVHNYINLPVTQDMDVVADRLEKELQKNYAGLFCDKVESIYKKLYNERLPENWLIRLNMLTTNIMIEDLPKQNKSILYYTSFTDKQNYDKLMNSSMVKMYRNLPLMKFIDKTERKIRVVNVDNDHLFWILLTHDKMNNDYDKLFKQINMPAESKHYHKMLGIELFDTYAIQIENIWHRFQIIKIENNDVTGIFIDLGIECIVSKSEVKFLPQKFLNIPSQAIKCSLTSLIFAPYFQVAHDLFYEMLFDKEFSVIPDNIESDVPFVTLYNGKCNMNSLIMDAIIQKTNFNKIDKTCKNASISYIADGYLYIHASNDTLSIMESILDSISASRPLNQLFSKKIISLNKLYLVKCEELGMWSRAVINDFLFTDRKFNVYFIDYGNYGLIDQDKLIDLQSLDPLLAAIGPQALKVSLNLFPPEKFTESQSKALYEMIIDKYLDIDVVTTNSDGIQVVELYDCDDESEHRISFNTLLYQSI